MTTTEQDKPELAAVETEAELLARMGALVEQPGGPRPEQARPPESPSTPAAIPEPQGLRRLIGWRKHETISAPEGVEAAASSASPPRSAMTPAAAADELGDNLDEDPDFAALPEYDDNAPSVVDHGTWAEVKPRTPRKLRRNRILDQLGWYEICARDFLMTSTRQAVATNPALMHTRPVFGGHPIGIDDSTGLYRPSDPYVLYDKDVIQSINVAIVGDVGVAKSTLVKLHYVLDQIAAGRRVVVFDRKKDKDNEGEYGRVAEFVERSGKKVVRIRFTRDGLGARVNLLDSRIISRGGENATTVGQDELLEMVAELIRREPLTEKERLCLSAAHRQAIRIAEQENRVPVLGDVVEALFDPDLEAIQAGGSKMPEGLIRRLKQEELAEWGLDLGLAFYRALDGSLSGLIDGPTAGANGEDLDLLDADLIVVETSSLDEGSAALMLTMTVMATFLASVWVRSEQQCVAIIEEGYTAAFPSVAEILRSLAKRGRAVGVCLVLVLHHLSDIPEDSPLASLFREAGIVHLFRQKEHSDAEHTTRLLGVPQLLERVETLAKGTHILLETSREPVVVSNFRTDAEKWITYTDQAITGKEGPASPFPDPFDPRTSTRVLDDLDADVADDLEGALN